MILWILGGTWLGNHPGLSRGMIAWLLVPPQSTQNPSNVSRQSPAASTYRFKEQWGLADRPHWPFRFWLGMDWNPASPNF